MKTLYIECNMGAAGDMLMAALLELCPEPEAFVEKLNALQIPKVTYKMEKSVKCGITGTHISVLVDGAEEESMDMHTHHHGEHSYNHEEHVHEHEEHGREHEEHVYEHEEHGRGHEEHVHEQIQVNSHTHSHAGIEEITHMISHLALPETVKQDAVAVYGLIAEAESHVHDRPVNEIHFHEVGNMDAVADVVGVCYLMHELGAEQVVTSAIHVGSGQVHCAHGVLPVPAPATAYILRGVPVYSREIRGELCTPTGAALLKHFSKSFGSMPVMCIEKIGYGMGKKDFEAANCVRVMLGESTMQVDII